MKKIEIVANQAVEEDIVELLTELGYGESFTYQHPVFGRGKRGRREGSAIWPETNVMFLLYFDGSDVDSFLKSFRELKNRFPEEGIKCWIGDGLYETL